MTVLDTRPSVLTEVLEARLASATDRHLSVAKEWFPHEYVPWSEGSDFDGAPYDETQSRLAPAVRAAVQLNLLTEDNLPAYHRELNRAFGDDEPWRTWVDRWTAEEGRHAIALRDYLVVTRSVDPVVLERERMATMSTGFRAPEKTMLRTLAYVSFQELATRVSHRNTGKLSGDAGLDRLLARIATDENLHMVFYRDLMAAALEADPAAALTAIATELETFAMPGANAPMFRRRAVAVARAGIYDMKVHREEIVEPLLRYWGVFELSFSEARAEQARDRIAAFCAQLDRRIERTVSR
ncbi:MAG: acyl-[acyl-carrier-protein] desaturase [Actinomycetota bacterium]|jgi:acyl-[acyl-carrier-protein] desaturase|nr:acyl-[acyl-carrier-protein] desaturase [Actinomycetota bacterium]